MKDNGIDNEDNEMKILHLCIFLKVKLHIFIVCTWGNILLNRTYHVYQGRSIPYFGISNIVNQ